MIARPPSRCQSDFHANKVLIACIIGGAESAEAVPMYIYSSSVCLPRRRGLVQKHVSGELLLASSKTNNHSPHIVHDSENFQQFIRT